MSFVSFKPLATPSLCDLDQVLERLRARRDRMLMANELLVLWGAIRARPALEQIGLQLSEIDRIAKNEEVGFGQEDFDKIESSIRSAQTYRAALGVLHHGLHLESGERPA